VICSRPLAVFRLSMPRAPGPACGVGTALERDWRSAGGASLPAAMPRHRHIRRRLLQKRLGGGRGGLCTEETRVRCWSRGCKGLGRIGGVGRWSTDSESQSAADGGPSEQLYGCGGGEQQVGALYFNFVCRCLRPRRGSSVHAGSFMAAGSSGRRGRAPAWPAPPPSPSP